jgi:hypothetical protein
MSIRADEHLSQGPLIAPSARSPPRPPERRQRTSAEPVQVLRMRLVGLHDRALDETAEAGMDVGASGALHGPGISGTPFSYFPASRPKRGRRVPKLPGSTSEQVSRPRILGELPPGLGCAPPADPVPDANHWMITRRRMGVATAAAALNVAITVDQESPLPLGVKVAAMEPADV